MSPKNLKKQQQGASNKDWGAHAEYLASEYYVKKGYAIRERNYKVGQRVEIDLICQKEDVMVFVEVKARTGDNQDPVDAVDTKKRMRMARGADIFLSNEAATYQYRFDIIAFTGTPEDYKVEIITDAFLAPLVTRFG